jgi:hypothetical protein
MTVSDKVGKALEFVDRDSTRNERHARCTEANQWLWKPMQ